MSIINIAEGCINLQMLKVSGCKNITDTSIVKVAKLCPSLHSLDIEGSWYKYLNITGTSVHKIVEKCPNLHSLNFWKQGKYHRY
jgi:hypothetical protein